MEGRISEDVIRTRAYLIWEREGRPSGRDYEHWVQAQIELEAERAKGNGGTRAAASPPAPARKDKAPPAGKTPPSRNVRVKRSS
jgi:hypothetical protein